jgi:hypothetical protein
MATAGERRRHSEQQQQQQPGKLYAPVIGGFCSTGRRGAQ